MGFLNEEETKSLSFILNKVKGGVIVIKTSPKNEREKISLEILENRTKIRPSYTNGKITIDIDIETMVAIDEYSTDAEFINDEKISVIEKKSSDRLRNDIDDVIRKVQRDFESDVFGFGNSVYKELPDIWRVQEKQWDMIFKDLDVSVNPNVKIIHSGLISKSMNSGE